ncbi:hypothetical protein DFR59_11472 [Falsibacillus pallidus]|uniref:Uncharacterized protein n=1 Tax=Falsibacillus pallidus TaxID=493781 RepID=A0A370GD70_9BACI|nr:hypothetical protein DFR59_11472 [Falsibacillus pallidus]
MEEINSIGGIVMTDNKFVVLLMMTIFNMILTIIFSGILISKANQLEASMDQPKQEGKK